MQESGKSGLSESRGQMVRAELIHLLESAAFRTSKRSREFLQHIVEHTLNGPDGALKERSIGVELFQLPQDFDTGQHTIVRVTANEVRKRLAQHYHAENGTPHVVKIGLSPGSYSADFLWGASEETPPPPAVGPHAAEGPPVAIATPPPVRLLPAAWLWGVGALVFAGGLLVWFTHSRGASAVRAPSSPLPIVASGTVDGLLRFTAGASDPYIDRSGRSWGPDRYFSGGTILDRPSERVYRTLDPDIYRHARTGDFRYDIPLAPGRYELHLYFAEIGLSDFISAESSGEGQRVFHVSANGTRILEAFDVVADSAGANISDERVFRDVAPAADGILHLAFSAVRGAPMVSAIEVAPMRGGKVRPLCIRAGWTSAWQDVSGRSWQADSYFLGGNALVRTTNPAQVSNSGAKDMPLYSSERWGHFSYALPVAEGRYRVTLKFCEGHYGRLNTGYGGVGSRLFDVFCNGVALVRNLDVVKEAGGEGRPLDRTFSGIRPNAQGKILLTFVPIRGMAFVNGIEVTEE